MRRVAFVFIGFLALAGLLGYAVTSGRWSGDESSSAATAADGGGEGASIGGATGAVMPVATDESASDAMVAEAVVEVAALPAIGNAVIRTAQISIDVGKEGFVSAFDAATLVAGKYGGYVQSSSMAGTEVRSGDLLLRVPADRFDDAMSDLRELGTVDGQSMSGEDVTAQFVDLEARLRAWQAQEAVLLDLMSQATSIEATIRVQSELQDVQVRIEQIKGELRLLEDRTEFATIQVSLREPGGPVAAQRVDDTARPSLGEAWERAIDGVLGVFYVVVVGLGYLVPIAAIAAIAWFAYRRVGRPRATPGVS
jgi:Domain of unknown function (DUF4349)